MDQDLITSRRPEKPTKQSTSEIVAEPMFKDPLMERIRAANNLPELAACHQELLAALVYPPAAMQILSAKTINLASKLQVQNANLRKQISDLQPEPLNQEEQGSIQQEVQLAPIVMVRKMVNDLEVQPKQVLVYKAMLQALIARVDKAEQASTALSMSTASSEAADREIQRLELELVRVETERNTMVEALRIAVSQGKINPVDEGRIQQAAGSAEQRARG